MTQTLIISGITVLCIILSLLIKPNIKIKGHTFGLYWIIAVVGAVALILSSSITLDKAWSGLTAPTSINPLKLLAIFFSMTALSVFLDELGFFEYLASLVVKKSKSNQKTLFRYLYIVVSLLTVFTSNDIVILTFTPFILYFAKNANINPMPFLISEFVAANTLSMTLIIGNPTNIYLASSYGLDFLTYLKFMIIPSVCSSVCAYFVLKLIFHKPLHEPILVHMRKVEIKNKFLLVTGLAHLIGCILALTVASYIGIEMWYVCVAFVLSLLTITTVYHIAKKQKPTVFIHCAHRLPYELVPFVISMFIIALSLHECGFTDIVCKALGDKNPIIIYGVVSTLSANVFNNIPMSVLFTNVLSGLTGGAQLSGLLATVIGSNIGAYLTPIGALAGIMWLEILKKNGRHLSFLSFMKYGVMIAFPVLLVALLGLGISFVIF